jgi:hypothetical protein
LQDPCLYLEYTHTHLTAKHPSACLFPHPTQISPKRGVVKKIKKKKYLDSSENIIDLFLFQKLGPGMFKGFQTTLRLPKVAS